MGKQMALQKKKQKEANNKKEAKDKKQNEKGNEESKITIKFKKGGTKTDIQIKPSAAVFELIDEYCQKTNTTSGTFKFGTQTLDPMDCRALTEVGMKEGDEIIIS